MLGAFAAVDFAPGATIGRTGGAALLAVGAVMFSDAAGRRWPGSALSLLLPLLRATSWITEPLTRLTAAALAPRTPLPDAGTSSSDDVDDLLAEGMPDDEEAREGEIITGVLTFGEKPVSSIATPRARVVALPAGLPADDVAKRVAASGFSRVPVLDETGERIEGMVLALDILIGRGRGPLPMRRVGRCKSHDSCGDVLVRMQQDGVHLAAVDDERSTFAGIVTLDDLLAELLGDIGHEVESSGARSA